MNEIKIITMDILLEHVTSYIKDEQEIEEIKKAYEYIAKKYNGEKRLTGEDYIVHPLNVAYILTDFYVDYKTIITALLHDVVVDYPVEIKEIEELFGEEVAKLVTSITKINKLSFRTDNEQMIQYYRKILIGLCEDVRVIFIKLAEKLHNMRTLYVLPVEKQKEKSMEALEILAPIAHRLGMYSLKSELEDLSLRYSKPEIYFDIVTTLNNTKAERDSAIIAMKSKIAEMLEQNNIENEIKGRSKSIYSIYSKLEKGRKFSDIYDILALRVYVETIPECYLTLGLIHSKYKPVPKRFKDYIAMPKENMYQSLHTTIFGEGGHLFEIQIRTYDMDKIAEYGIASHWSYKEKSDASNMKNVMEQKLELFRSLIEMEESEPNFVNSVKQEVFDQNIYVFTPKGDVIELPFNSTPIDFAYRVHSAVGDKMVGAIVNDVIVPLDYELKGGEIIKINTSKSSEGPKREWLNMVKTTQAKNKIKAHFTKIERDEFIARGEELLEKELKKNKIPMSDFFTDENLSQLSEELDVESWSEVYRVIGNNRYSPTFIFNTLYKDTKSKEELILDKLQATTKEERSSKNEVLVAGIDDIKVSLASCCTPIKNDSIIGYITRGHGVTIHRVECHNIANLEERIVDVVWNDKIQHKYPTIIAILAHKKDNILLDIIGKTTGTKTTVQTINTYQNGDYITYEITIQVEDTNKLQKFMSDIKGIPGIESVERVIR